MHVRFRHEVTAPMGCAVSSHLLEHSGRMQAAFVVVRCPLTPYDSDPWKSSRARPTAWDGITPMWPAYEPVATSLQE